MWRIGGARRRSRRAWCALRPESFAGSSVPSVAAFSKAAAASQLRVALDPSNVLARSRSKRPAVDAKEHENSKASHLIHVDLAGHLGIVGPNASGKRSALKALYEACAKAKIQVEIVDFEAHRQAVIDNGHLPVARFLGGIRDNADVIVRFGLSSLWWRRIKSLSTGEVRKVLLAKAVCNNPQVLFLDRPYDGLDAKARKSLAVILDEVSNDTQAKQARPLVQGIKWQERMPLKVVIATHRGAQELSSRVKNVLICAENDLTIKENKAAVFTQMDKTGLERFSDGFEKYLKHMFQMAPISRSPSFMKPLAGFAGEGPTGVLEPLLDIQRLSVFPVQTENDVLEGKDPMRPLLDRVSWCVHPREVWWVQGENGASKSILLSCAIGPQRLLALASQQHAVREWEVETDAEADRRRRRPPSVACTDSVEMVSTELHIAILEGPRKTMNSMDYLIKKAKLDRPNDAIETILHGLGLDPKVVRESPFNELSIGQQKLLLVAGAFARRPRLLILDEPCQSLDLEHRRRVASMVDQYCGSKVQDVSCIFVSHHEDELPRSVSHRLVLDKGRITSRGHYNVPAFQPLGRDPVYAWRRL